MAFRTSEKFHSLRDCEEKFYKICLKVITGVAILLIPSSVTPT